MFYVSDTDIYLMTYDEENEYYAKVEMHKDTQGNFYMKKLSQGVKTKPANRQICTTEELIAQFGSAAIDDAAVAEEAAI